MRQPQTIGAAALVQLGALIRAEKWAAAYRLVSEYPATVENLDNVNGIARPLGWLYQRQQPDSMHWRQGRYPMTLIGGGCTCQACGRVFERETLTLCPSDDCPSNNGDK